MTEKSAGQTLLENAYKLKTPEDSSKYYDAFAGAYDSDFAEALGWRYPDAIAALYRDHATPSDAPVADIGCGTGLVGAALKLPAEQIHGVDISEEMLRIAGEKKVYGALYRVDLTQSLERIENDYGAVLSAGTFTTGHLGPETLESLLSIARAGALYVIGVKRAFFEEAGFDPVVRALESGGLIRDLQVVEFPMYAKDGHDHAQETAFALVFRKA